MFRLFYAALLAATFSTAAFAACTSPAGQESQTRYDYAAHKMYYCNNSVWVEMGGVALMVDESGSCADGGDVRVVWNAAQGKARLTCEEPAPPPPLPDCQSRVTTSNSYIPHAQCVNKKNQDQALCNADSECRLAGYYDSSGDGVDWGWGPTRACKDGGGGTGLTQWSCRPRADIGAAHRPISP